MGDALAFLRDVGALALLALLGLRVMPALVSRLDYLGACLSRVASAWSVELPPPPPPLPPLWRLFKEFPMRKFLLGLLAVLVPLVVLSGCAATDAATYTGKRALCAFGDGVGTAARIWCNEPVGPPGASSAYHHEAAPARVRLEVVHLAPEAARPGASASAAVPASPVGVPGLCTGPGCDVPDPAAYRRGDPWRDPWGDPAGWVRVRALEPLR